MPGGKNFGRYDCGWHKRDSGQLVYTLEFRDRDSCPVNRIKIWQAENRRRHFASHLKPSPGSRPPGSFLRRFRKSAWPRAAGEASLAGGAWGPVGAGRPVAARLPAASLLLCEALRHQVFLVADWILTVES